MSSSLKYAKNQLESFIAEVRYIKESEFPYRHSRDAILEIENFIQGYLDTLDKLDPKENLEIIRSFCDASVKAASNHLPIIGFILRSTTLRNAFEVYGPLLKITRQLVGVDTKLIISSDWDCIPFNFRVPSLKEYVLIGLPVHESSNPFLIPLAGHELGHTVSLDSWLTGSDCEKEIKKELEKLVLDNWAEVVVHYPGVSKNPPKNEEIRNDLIVAIQILDPAFTYITKQLTETFCDFVGLYLFGESFLDANAYMLSSHHHSDRSPFYPSINRRVENLLTASKTYGITPPENYQTMFKNLEEIQEVRMKFLLKLADEICLLFVGKLIEEVKKIATAHSIPVRDKGKVSNILNDFKKVVPTQGADNLTNILNAGWTAWNDEHFWDKNEYITNKKETLSDLILKSIEVLEVEQRMAE